MQALAMGSEKAKNMAETRALTTKFDERLRRLTELTGKLPDESHKGILLRFLDDTTKAHLTQYHNTDSYESFRIRVMSFVNANVSFDKKTLAQVGEASSGANRGVKFAEEESWEEEDEEEEDDDQGGLNAMQGKARVCYNCGEKGHVARECTKRKG